MDRFERFLKSWRDHWRTMDPEGWVSLYHPEGTLLQPGMERPLTRGELADHVRRIHALLPDIRCEQRNWAARGDTLFVEWALSATFGGEPLCWEGADQFTLSGEQAFEEVVYFDTLPLWGRVDPAMKRGGLLDAPYGWPGLLRAPAPLAVPPREEPDEGPPQGDEFARRYASAWGSPRLDTLSRLYHPDWHGRTPTTGGTIDCSQLPAYYEKIMSVLPDFRLEVNEWAVRDATVFIEWTISGTLAGERCAWDGVDRHMLIGARSIDGVSYFDTLPLWSQIDPKMRRGFVLAGAAR